MASEIPGWVSVASAADQLRVSPAQIRELANAGHLEAIKLGRSLMISADSVARRIAAKPAPGRPLAPKVAWTVLLLASGQPPPWPVPPSEKVRLRKFLRRPIDEWSRLFARRAGVSRVRIPEGVRRRIATQPGVALGGDGAARHHGAPLLVSDVEPTELYLTQDTYMALRGRKGIGWDSPSPNTILRMVPDDPLLHEILATGVVPSAVAAADLLDRGDDRSRRVATDLLRHDR